MKTKFKVPFIEQYQKTECGLCCVAMISSYYFHEISVKELRDEYEVGRDGTTFLKLKEILESKGFKVKSYKIPNNKFAIKKINNVSIALWKSKHFIVVEKVSNKFVYVLDPEIGRIIYTTEEFLEGFSNYIISVEKTNKVKFRKIKLRYKYLLDILLSQKGNFIKLLFSTIILYFSIFLIPIGMRNIINQLNSGKVDLDYFNTIFLLLFASLSYYICLVLQNKSAINLRANLDYKITTSVIQKMFKLPYKFFTNRSCGDLIYSINGIPRIRELFAQRFIMGVLDIILLISIATYFIITNLFIFFTAIILLVLNLSLLSLSKSTIEQNNLSLMVQQNKVQNKQMEIVYSMFGIKMEAAEDEIYLNWLNNFDKYIYKYKATENYSNHINSLLKTLNFISPFVIMVIAILLYSKNHLDIGNMVALYSLSNVFFSKVESIFNTVIAILQSKVFIARIYDILEEKNEEYGIEKININGNIELNNVTFSFTKNSKDVLKDVNIKINKGEKIAIVGASGSGKTTISKLIVGLFSASKGKIKYDGYDFNEIDMKYLRKQIGIVPQDMTLFNKTILENITNGLEYNMSDVENACKLTNIHNDIMNMPLKYNTLISEMGMNLSGGQRQRIILARALLKKPKVILLDEATSYLDTINESEIMNNFKKNNVTTVVIAHRLSTIIDSDKIYVFEDGQIKEFGNHNELMNLKNGVYNSLYNIK